MHENHEANDLGEMSDGSVDVYVTSDNYVVVQATVSSEDDPVFGVILPPRAALTLAKAIDKGARQALRGGKKAPLWSDEDLN